MRARRTDGWRKLPGLRRATPRAGPATRRHRRHGQSRYHKVAGIRDAIEATGAELRYLPPYSPDLNPIEQLFAKLKALLRKAAARTLDALIAAIALALTAFTPQECSNYLIDKGYRHKT